MYSNTESGYRVNSHYTDSWGERQGDKLSPTLFSIFINDMAVSLKDLDVGVKVGDKKNPNINVCESCGIISWRWGRDANNVKLSEQMVP